MGSARVGLRERQYVAERARHLCEYCRSPENVSVDPYVVEHILPTSREGTSAPDNLALACGGCNGHKYNRTHAPDPLDGELLPLFDPRQARWAEHFAWSPDFTIVVGLTGAGRATVEALHLNRPGLVKLRRLLYAAGEHPPVEAEGLRS